MYAGKAIRITNIQRQEQRNKRKQKQHWWLTPPKSVLKKYIGWKIDSKADQFGYDFEPGQSNTLKYMKEKFQHKSAEYYGGHQKPKILKNKDKYEKNLEIGKPFKKNPLLKIFNRIENKIQKTDKLVAFQAIKISAV